ncbi:NAD(P)/FAD-dependent oxidoreductase [Piscibacillus halophilus]|uniref:D-amino-acid dehydrogenase n=1 Tax=Piscibacillus halophilus TaxID=571933 RepID=A0A1H9HJX5_9BACI|nr:FAD-dependent oxidoreductase [Piscibacillus halophilus]SEQ62532.1 D-amino-acid dehydrogenase [Piscibacillus halophilus]
MTHVVIGAGIVGASAAYHLVKKGHDVVLIDNNLEGRATTAGAGIICPWVSSIDDQAWYTLARGGALYYPNLISELEKDGETNTGYGLTGALAVSEDDKEIDEIYQHVQKKKKDTEFIGEVKKLDHDQAKELFPPLNKKLKALYVEGGARVDGKLLTQALVNSFVNNGGRLVENTAQLERKDDQVLVKIGKETIEANEVIVAAGAWSNDLLDPLDLKINLEAQRGQIVHLKVDEDTSKWPAVLPQSSHYMVAFNDSRIAFGATREDGSGFDYRMTAGGVQEVLNEGLSVAPGLEDATLGEVRIGFRPKSPDFKPYFGKVETYDNLTIATGLGATGLTIGPYLGKLAAQLVSGEELKIELSNYNPFR